MRKYIKIYFILFAIIFFIMPVFAEDNELTRLTYGEDRWIALHFLLQAQTYSQNNYDLTAGESERDAIWNMGFQLRRSRIILNGEVAKNIEFFMQTDDILVGNQGYGSSYASSADYDTAESGETVNGVKDIKGVFTQDAYINYKFADEFELAVGKFPLPFMHHNLESAASLLGVDYNSAVIPLGSTTDEGRDTGFEIRGLGLKLFDYRIAVFRGLPRDTNGTSTHSDDINPHGMPRFCGRLQINFADPETGFFYSGNYLGKKNVLSVGGGVDYQPDAVRINNILRDYFAWTGDATIDYRISDDMVAVFQGAYVTLQNRPEVSSENEIKKQNGFFIQAGVLLYGILQPVIRYQYWDGNAVLGTAFKKDEKISYITTGLNYIIKGHNANIKAEYQNPAGRNKAVSGEKKATVQFQIFI